MIGVGRVRRQMEHHFTGPSYTIGIEEELMIVDADSYELVNAIESVLEDARAADSDHAVGDIKPELMESVLEIATQPAANTAEAGAQLRALRRQVHDVAARRGLTIGSAGTHPFALWEDQRIASRLRYRELVNALRFVARQELIFGLHVHVGVDDPDKAIHVANGMRVHLPVLLALSANSPFWRGDGTGMASTRLPIFRAFPRVGVPPSYRDWADYEREIEFMISSGVMEDYTYLWYDVRPHPKLGTVEIRACDAQTRVEHTLGLAALIQAMVKELCEHFDSGQHLGEYPWQMLDENRWLAARHGLDGQLVDLPSNERVATRDLARRLLDRLHDHAVDLGSVNELEGVEDLLSRGNGAARQVVVYEANHDLREVMAEIVAATTGDGETEF
jgi:carboxylate-amine ligase